jgi:hypothetical protein
LEADPEGFVDRMPAGVQTNEVRRSCALQPGFLAEARAVAGLPLRLLEVGASAGLNLGCSFVWADQVERFRTLALAIALARDTPMSADRAVAVEWLEQQLPRTTPRRGLATVVFHSVVLIYLSPEARARFTAATADGPQVWLSMEPGSAGQQAEVRLTQWPPAAGESRLSREVRSGFVAHGVISQPRSMSRARTSTTRYAASRR